MGCGGDGEEAAARGHHDARPASGHGIFFTRRCGRRPRSTHFCVNPLLRRGKSGDMGIRRRRNALQERHDDTCGHEGRVLASKPRRWLKTSYLPLVSNADFPPAIDLLGRARARINHARAPPLRLSEAEGHQRHHDETPEALSKAAENRLTGPTGPPILPAVLTKQTVQSRGVRCPLFGSADSPSSPALTTPVAHASVWLFIPDLRDERSAPASLELHRPSQSDIAVGLDGGQRHGEPDRR